MGVNIEALLHRCQVAEQTCAHYDSSEINSGLWLGAALGELARQGRDKLTFVVSPPIESFGLWVEQLVAESTGKQGRGILPVADEPLGDSAEAYGDDRVFAYLRNTEEPDAAARRRRSTRSARRRPPDADAGHARRRRPRPDLLPGRVRGRGRRLGARDQPVRPAQRAGGQGQHQAGARRPARCPSSTAAGDEQLRALLGDAGPPHYVAIMGYLPPSDEFDAAVAELRAAIRAATGRGDDVRLRPALPALDRPAAQGRAADRPLPAARQRRRSATPRSPAPGYSFGTLIAAQAAGDLQTLRAHGLPAERVKLDGEPVAAVRASDRADHRATEQGAEQMQIGFVGLGKMGGNMVHRIRRDSDHEVVAFDFSADAVKTAESARRGRRGLARGAGRTARRRRARSGSWCRPATPRSRRSRS